MRALFLALVALTVTACSGQRPLHDTSGEGGGPDEFAVTPTRPLSMPETFDLPAPTPGQGNLVDIDPNAEAIAALGGNAAARTAGGVPARDRALVTQASRNGVTDGIREVLAEEDAAFRTNARRFGIFSAFRSERYFRVYASQALDAYAELERFRNAGIPTPTAPPNN